MDDNLKCIFMHIISISIRLSLSFSYKGLIDYNHVIARRPQATNDYKK